MTHLYKTKQQRFGSSLTDRDGKMIPVQGCIEHCVTDLKGKWSQLQVITEAVVIYSDFQQGHIPLLHLPQCHPPSSCMEQQAESHVKDILRGRTGVKVEGRHSVRNNRLPINPAWVGGGWDSNKYDEEAEYHQSKSLPIVVFNRSLLLSSVTVNPILSSSPPQHRDRSDIWARSSTGIQSLAWPDVDTFKSNVPQN